MHETGIVRDLVRRLVSAAQEADASAVSGVDVWLGALSQFAPGHFRVHFDEEARGTLAQGAALRITASDDPTDPDAMAVMIRGIDLEVPEARG